MRPSKTFVRTTLFALPVLAAAAAFAQIPSQGSKPKPWQNPRAAGMPGSMTQAEYEARVAEGKRLDALQLELVNRGRTAEKRGDLDAAASLYLEACTATGEDSPFKHDNLARVYDKQGREREAYVQYGIALKGQEGSWSSIQVDARRLARYGDLCLLYGTPQDAIAAYAEAVRNARGDEARDEPRPLPRAETVAAYRSAAHVASATRHRSHGNSADEMRELDLAVQADGDDWIARLYRARVLARKGRKAEAGREATLATRLAGPQNADRVRAMRARYKIPDAAGTILPWRSPGPYERWDGHTYAPGIGPGPHRVETP